MNDEQKRALYIELRDKHVDQLMEINGKATFAILALTVSLLTGLAKLPSLSGGYFAAAIAALVAGIVLLTVAAVMLSNFHTRNIFRLQTKAHDLTDPNPEDFTVIPVWRGIARLWCYPFFYVFAGSISLVLFVLVLVIHAFVGPKEEAAPPCCVAQQIVQGDSGDDTPLQLNDNS